MLQLSVELDTLEWNRSWNRRNDHITEHSNTPGPYENINHIIKLFVTKCEDVERSLLG